MSGVNAQLTTGSFGGGTDGSGSLYYSNSTGPSVSASGVGPATINMSNQLTNIDTRLKDIEARLVFLFLTHCCLKKHQALKEAYDHYKLMESY